MPPTFHHLHLEPIGGLAGDMFLAALLELGAAAGAIQAHFERTGKPGLRLVWEDVLRQGERARHVRAIAPLDDHHHAHLDDVLAVVDSMGLPAAACGRAGRVFQILAEAEAAAHATEVGEVLLHEVGALDSIMDVAGVAVALDQLGNPAVSCRELPSGQGYVDTSHGRLQCPVPAVRIIAERHGIVLASADLPGETITPTGIALLAEARSGGEAPAGAPRARAAGAGSRDFLQCPNVLRILAW